MDGLLGLPKRHAGECWEEVREGTSCTRDRAPSPPWDPPLQAFCPLLPVARSFDPTGERVLPMATPGQGHPVPGAPRLPAHGGGNSRYPRERPRRESLAVWGQRLPLSKSPFFRGFGREEPSKPHEGLSRGLRGHWQLLEGPPTLPGGTTCWAELRAPQRHCGHPHECGRPAATVLTLPTKGGFPGSSDLGAYVPLFTEEEQYLSVLCGGDITFSNLICTNYSHFNLSKIQTY